MVTVPGMSRGKPGARPESPMSRIATLAALTLSLSLGLAAQTTGIPCCNDYTINGFGSGTTSCTPYFNPPLSPLVFAVETTPTATSVFFAFACQCLPGSVVFPGCCGTLVSIDIDLSCLFGAPIGPFPVTSAPNVCGTPGTASWTVPFCPPLTRFATQALVLDPNCSSGFYVTQAYDVTCL